MLGAIATTSVKASRQADGGGAAGGSEVSRSGLADGSSFADGASEGRGLGKGTFAAAKTSVRPQQASSIAIAVTMATLPLREGHLRHPFSALDFAPIRAKEPRKAIAPSGGTFVCLA